MTPEQLQHLSPAPSYELLSATLAQRDEELRAAKEENARLMNAVYYDSQYEPDPRLRFLCRSCGKEGPSREAVPHRRTCPLAAAPSAPEGKGVGGDASDSA